jgi:hypothetical protein
MDEHPAGALRNVATHQQDGEAEHRAETEREPPAQVGGEEALVEQDHRQDRAAGGAKPERPVDDQIDPTADPGGISSSMAELMAAYSPPIPAPVKNRQRYSAIAHQRHAVRAKKKSATAIAAWVVKSRSVMRYSTPVKARAMAPVLSIASRLPLRTSASLCSRSSRSFALSGEPRKEGASGVPACAQGRLAARAK